MAVPTPHCYCQAVERVREGGMMSFYFQKSIWIFDKVKKIVFFGFFFPSSSLTRSLLLKLHPYFLSSFCVLHWFWFVHCLSTGGRLFTAVRVTYKGFSTENNGSPSSGNGWRRILIAFPSALTTPLSSPQSLIVSLFCVCAITGHCLSLPLSLTHMHTILLQALFCSQNLYFITLQTVFFYEYQQSKHH